MRDTCTERYIECEICGEGYEGEDLIRAYIREVEGPATSDGLGEVIFTCIGCVATSVAAG